MSIGTPVRGTLVAASAAGVTAAPGLPAGISGQGVLFEIFHGGGGWGAAPTDWQIILHHTATTCEHYIIGREYADAATAATVGANHSGAAAFIARAVWVPGATIAGVLTSADWSGGVSIPFNFLEGIASVPANAMVFAVGTKTEDFTTRGTAGGTDTTVCSPMGTHSGLTWTELYEMATFTADDCAGVLNYAAVGGSSVVVGVTGTIASEENCDTIGSYFALLESGPAEVADLEASTASLEFSATEGGPNPANQTFDVTNVGDAGGVLTYGVSDNAAWLTVSGGDGSAPDTLTVAVDVTGLVPDVYNATITVNPDEAGDPDETIAVTLTVTAAGGGGMLLLGVG